MQLVLLVICNLCLWNYKWGWFFPGWCAIMDASEDGEEHPVYLLEAATAAVRNRRLLLRVHHPAEVFCIYVIASTVLFFFQRLLARILSFFR